MMQHRLLLHLHRGPESHDDAAIQPHCDGTNAFAARARTDLTEAGSLLVHASAAHGLTLHSGDGTGGRGPRARGRGVKEEGGGSIARCEDVATVAEKDGPVYLGGGGNMNRCTLGIRGKDLESGERG